MVTSAGDKHTLKPCNGLNPQQHTPEGVHALMHVCGSLLLVCLKLLLLPYDSNSGGNKRMMAERVVGTFMLSRKL